MRRAHPRLRKTTKWAGLAVSVILLAVWIISVWWAGYCLQGGYNVGVGGGRIYVNRLGPMFGAGPSARLGVVRILRPNLRSWPSWRGDSAGWTVLVPIWMLWLPVTIATAAAWRFDALARRMARAGCCAECGYSLSGLAPGSACPECGHARSA